MSFEDHLRRLETIVEQLDSSTLELNAALSLFEEGVELLREASHELNVAESRIHILVEKADGIFHLDELDE